jgi:twinkle protein
MDLQIEIWNNLQFDLGGKIKGQTAIICPRCSNDRKKKKSRCMGVNIDSGMFHCFHCDWSGNIHKFKSMNEKKYNKPVLRNNTKLSDKLVKWFKDRGISQNTLIKMKIGEGVEFMPQCEKELNTVQFNYFRDGELINTKFRTGDKNFKLVSGAELIFYNLDAIKDTNEVIITEGEIDALSFIEVGIDSVVSVPNGANKNLQYLDNCIDYFVNKEKIIIATDNDTKGIELKKELARRLGFEKCWLIDFKDCKDANEYLIKYGAIELENSLKNVRPYPIDGVFQVKDFEAEILSLYEVGLKKGFVVGFDELDNLISFELGRLVTVTGKPGDGKSEVVDNIVTKLNLTAGWKCAYFSPENYPLNIHFSKLAEKLIGKSFSGENKMTLQELKQAMDYVNDNFFFIMPKDETFSLENILEKARFLIQRYGIKMLVIDPYNKLENQVPAGMSETNFIGKQLDMILNFQHKYNIMTILVAHPAKLRKDKDGNYPVATLYDINGSANFYNKTDFGLSIFRNIPLSKVEVHVQKVKFRHLGQVGVAEFTYNMNNGRLTTVILDRPQWDNSNWLTKKANFEYPEYWDV